MAEVADTFGADDVLGPLGGYEAVKLMDVEGRTAIIDEGADAILFGLTLLIMMMVMVVMAMFLFLFFFVMVKPIST